jgi:lipoprotein-anchoring transpeptidase ErfK/SrfK
MVLVSMLCAAEASAAPLAGSELSTGDLGWPTGTTAAAVRHRTSVLDAIDRGKRIGVIQSGMRITWKRIVAASDGCRAWLELEPRGWVCARDVAPTDKPPSQDAPPSQREAWADIRTGGADAFDDEGAIKAGSSHHIGDKTFVALRPSRPLVVDGVRYYRTDQGWIAGGSLLWYEPSPFSGIELAQTPLDFAWAVARRPGAKIEVRDEATPKAKVVRKLAPRERVTVYEVADSFARIGTDEWVDVGELRRPERAARPDGVAAGERWIDVDLDQQWLVAYEGDTPVFVTLVSTGRPPDWSTPTGIYRITFKEAVARMQDPGGLAEEWNVADVPWSMHFRRNFALHGTYWHDGFGRVRSHGCVNLSTQDAKRLYAWSTPNPPLGWTEIESERDRGTPVRIRNRRDPTPIWRDYEGRPIKR